MRLRAKATLRSIRTAIVLVTVLALAGAGATANATPQPPVRVRVINRSHVAEDVIRAATECARGIFRRAGIEVSYVGVEPAASRNVTHDTAFSIVLATGRSSAKHVLGAADIASQTAWVLVHNVRDTAQQTRIDEATILGHVIAHELGHLLLRSPDHSVAGVMSDPMDFTLAERGALTFQAEQIRRLHGFGR